MYIIEIDTAVIEHQHNWVRSQAWPGHYTEEEATDIVVRGKDEAGDPHAYRMGTVTPVSHKYRRHAAVTPLEIRGAVALLESANNRLSYPFDIATSDILREAKLACKKDLEAL
jgi:hypothetical protein